MPTVPALYAGLVDDAGLFPPARLPMDQAVAAHFATISGPYADLTTRFLCPEDRVDELVDALPDQATLTLGLILPPRNSREKWSVSRRVSTEGSAVTLGLVELPLPSDSPDLVAAAADAVEALSDLPEGVRAFVELPRARGWREAMAVVAGAGLGAKVRCGGLVHEAFPSERELADFLLGCVKEGLSFKATAGLHHAARHTDPTTGFEHHGFLNLLLAVGDALGGDDPLATLAERSPERLAARASSLSEEDQAAIRRTLVAYGSCSIAEPVDDLVDLGLLERA